MGNGPVVRELYKAHRGEFHIAAWPKGDATALSDSQKGTVDAVLSFYGDKPAAWLSELTHIEAPWLDARAGLPAGARSNREITHAAMAEYYEGLVGTTGVSE